MKTMIHSVAALLLTISFAAQANSYWSVNYEYNVAETSFDNGIAVAVMFYKSTGCNEAGLLIKGNGTISNLIVVIDGETFTNSDGRPGFTHDNGVAYDINDDFLHALKHGNHAAIVTNRGTITMSLQGSAKAINQAWQACLANLNGYNI